MLIKYINRTTRFKHTYKSLPQHIRDDFDKKITLFVQNPRTPQLRTHKLKGKLQGCLAFCLRDGFRVLFDFASNDTVNLIDIGPHNKYRVWGK